MMPGEDRRRTAMGAPGFRELAGGALTRSLVEPQDLAAFDLHGEVAGRPDVGAALGEQQVDLCRPAADALDRDELGDRFLVILRQGGEVQAARGNPFGQAARLG
jgi:hypothetical protein